MKKQRIVAGFATAVVAALALTGCGSADDDANGQTSQPNGTNGTGTDNGNGGGAATTPDGFPEGSLIGVALPQQTSENWVLAEHLFNDGLAAAGFEAIVQFANDGVNEQQNQIDAMIELGARVIVVGAIDGAQLGPQLERAHNEGIVVIAYDRLLTQTVNVDLYVAFDNFQVGVEQGNSLLAGLSERMEGQEPWNIELIAGSADDANSIPFFEGAMSVLQPEIDAGRLVIPSGQSDFGQVATDGWLAANAQARMDTIIAGFYNDGTPLHGILSPNDTLGRAALTAAASAGLETPVVTGQDSEVESVRSILEGVQFSTIYKDTRALVAETINQIVLAQQGQALMSTTSLDNGSISVPTYFLEPIAVTQANAFEVFSGDPILEPVLDEFR